MYHKEQTKRMKPADDSCVSSIGKPGFSFLPLDGDQGIFIGIG
jgi:hypothetical protein